MKIQPIPQDKIVWKGKIISKKRYENVEKINYLLDNKKRLSIVRSDWYTLQTLYDSLDNWIKSKLRFRNGRTIRSINKHYEEEQNKRPTVLDYNA